jgi:formylmethanofuran dehydrogenase subunit E
MSATDYADLSRHIGHQVEVVAYADINVAIECEECNEVLMDFDREEDKSELTYCEECLRNLEEDKFDYRFNRPVCLECVESNEELNPENERETRTEEKSGN